MNSPETVTSATGVLFISSAENPGADTFIHMLIMRSLDRARFHVHVACSAGPEGARTAGYEALRTIPDVQLVPSNFGPSLTGRSGGGKIIGLIGGGVATVASFAKLARYVQQHRIAVIHSTDRPRDAVACAILGKLTGAKSIIHAHLKCADWMGRALRTSLRHVDGLMAISEFVGGSLVDCGYPRERVHVVLNAIDLPAWDYRMDPGPVRRELGIAPGAPVIACAARLFRGKGQDDLIRALPPVRAQFPDLRVLIIGRDDRFAMKTSFRAELEMLARQEGVADCVQFTGQRNDMPAVMAASDIFALPSYEEPFGLVFLEAMAMKKPVVAIGNGGTPEVVEHGRSGLLAPPDDPQAFAQHLLTLLRDPSLRATFGEYGRRQVETRFTADRMAEDAAAVYSKLIAPARLDRTALAGGSAA